MKTYPLLPEQVQAAGEFHASADLPISRFEQERFDLRASMFSEEHAEEFEAALASKDIKLALDGLCDSLYIAAGSVVEWGDLGDHFLEDELARQLNMCSIATYSFMGIVLNKDMSILKDAFQEVHRSNMSKFWLVSEPEPGLLNPSVLEKYGPGYRIQVTNGRCCYIGDSGKVLKPKGFREPDLQPFVDLFMTQPQ